MTLQRMLQQRWRPVHAELEARMFHVPSSSTRVRCSPRGDSYCSVRGPHGCCRFDRCCRRVAALLIRWRLRDAAPNLRSWRAWLIWGLQSALVALVLLLLWQPAIDGGRAELAAEHHRRGGGRLAQHGHRRQRWEDPREPRRWRRSKAAFSLGSKKRFQTRIYRLGSATRRGVDRPEQIAPVEAATHIERRPEATRDRDRGPAGGRRPAAERRRRKHGRDRRLGIISMPCSALRNRRLPVHTIGFGKETCARRGN